MGQLYRGRSFYDGKGRRKLSDAIAGKSNGVDLCFGGSDPAVGMLMQKLAVPNTQFHYYKP